MKNDPNGDADERWAAIFELPADALRFAVVVSRLSRHLAEPVMVTGSFAVEWHLRIKNGDARKRRLNDIDIVAAKGGSDIGVGLKNDFLIHHFHPTRESGNVLMQLVEPHTRTRVDIFSPRSPTVRERVSAVNVAGTDCEVVAAEDLAARLLAIVRLVLDGTGVDPKYFDALTRLMAVTDAGLAATLWNDYRRSGDPAEFGEAFGAVTREIRLRPDLLKATEYSQDVGANCPWCVESADFPLAPRTQIYEILSYV